MAVGYTGHLGWEDEVKEKQARLQAEQKGRERDANTMDRNEFKSAFNNNMSHAEIREIKDAANRLSSIRDSRQTDLNVVPNNGGKSKKSRKSNKSKKSRKSKKSKKSNKSRKSKK
jgi:hypothetical protein